MTSKEDWYGVTGAQISERSGDALLALYNQNQYLMLSTVFPEVKFLPWKFPRVVKGFWQNVENRNRYISWLKTEVRKLTEDELTQRDFLENHGLGLMNLYNNSPKKIIDSLKEKEKEEKDEKLKGENETMAELFRKLAERVGFDSNSNNFGVLYRLTYKDFTECGGAGLLQTRFGSSPYLFLKTALPGVAWEPWRFPRMRKELLEDPAVEKGLLNFISTSLHLKTEEDWQR